MTAYLEEIQKNFQETQDFLTNTLEKVSNPTQDFLEKFPAINKVNAVTTQGVTEISDAAVEKLQEAIVLAAQNWLKSHPILAWLLTHPLASLVIILVTILLFWGLLKSIVKMTEQVWLTLFKSPLKLGKCLLVSISKLFNKTSLASAVYYRQSGSKLKQERLAYILNRLEEIKKEEAEILKEMKTLIL